MTSRVEEDSVVTPRLVVGLHRTERHGLPLGFVEVGDIEVEVCLLRLVAAGPYWPLVVRNLLKGDRGTLVAAKLDPLTAVVVELKAGQRTVERGECLRVGTVKGDEAEPSNSGHVSHHRVAG